MDKMEKNSLCALNDYCQKGKIDMPVYEYKFDKKRDKHVFDVRVEHLKVSASHTVKREAKQRVAQLMLEKLEKMEAEVVFSKKPDAPAPELVNSGVADFDERIEYINLLRYYCLKRNRPIPKLQVTSELGTEGAFLCYTAVCRIPGVRVYGLGRSRVAAMQRAALEMLKHFMKENLGPPLEGWFSFDEIMKKFRHQSFNRRRDLFADLPRRGNCTLSLEDYEGEQGAHGSEGEPSRGNDEDSSDRCPAAEEDSSDRCPAAEDAARPKPFACTELTC